jgi:hypothetical protein
LATSSIYGSKIKEASNEKEISRKKEVDDLISKYARKKAPPPPPPTQSSHHIQRDYSSTSLKYGASRDSLYGVPSRDNLYGGASRDNFYGGGPRDNLYGGYAPPAPPPSTHVPPPRRSSQYEIPNYAPPPEPTHNYERNKYLSTSKSSSNLYLQPQYGGGYMDPNSRLQSSRQQKTLSMHGTSGRNNNVMETAASIIANAQQAGLGLGPTDWWSSNQPSTANTTGLQHSWSQKNVWNPAAAVAATSGTAIGARQNHHHPVHHPAPPIPVSIFNYFFARVFTIYY